MFHLAWRFFKGLVALALGLIMFAVLLALAAGLVLIVAYALTNPNFHYQPLLPAWMYWGIGGAWAVERLNTFFRGRRSSK
jgi:hypothetical protein